jgi:hypothetical protein
MYPPITFKDGVQVKGVNQALFYALEVAQEIYAEYGKDVVVTSGTDGKHKQGSLHYVGLAVDIRTRHLTPREKTLIYVKLQRELKPYLATDGIAGHFDVILETDHIHIELDRRINK